MGLLNPTENDAYIVSLISLIVTAVACVVGLSASDKAQSAATFGYAVENFVDTLCSVLVVWRFWGGGKTTSIEELASREKRASVAIGITFILLAIAVGYVAGIHLTDKMSPEDPLELIMITAPSFVISFGFGCLQLWFGGSRNLSSPALVKDGFCSLCGAYLSLGVLFDAFLQYIGSDVWWLDGAFAIVISVALLGVGVMTLIGHMMEGARFWELTFWIQSPPNHGTM